MDLPRAGNKAGHGKTDNYLEMGGPLGWIICERNGNDGFLRFWRNLIVFEVGDHSLQFGRLDLG